MANPILDLSTNFKLRSILLFNHLLAIYALIYHFDFGYLALSYLLGFLLGGIGISIGYHRYFAHYSFKTNKFYKLVLTAIGHFCSVGSAITWVGIHRDHHAHSDTKEDPHSPIYNGWLRTLVHVWEKNTINPIYVRHLLKDKTLKFQHRYYFHILIGAITISLLLLGPVTTAYIYSIPAIHVFYATGIVNSVNHWGGKPNNIPLLNIFTSGESYHANHHDNVANWRFGSFDPMAPIIRLIKE